MEVGEKQMAGVGGGRRIYWGFPDVLINWLLKFLTEVSRKAWKLTHVNVPVTLSFSPLPPEQTHSCRVTRPAVLIESRVFAQRQLKSISTWCCACSSSVICYRFDCLGQPQPVMLTAYVGVLRWRHRCLGNLIHYFHPAHYHYSEAQFDANPSLEVVWMLAVLQGTYCTLQGIVKLQNKAQPFKVKDMMLLRAGKEATVAEWC